jgi:hypothetical protein
MTEGQPRRPWTRYAMVALCAFVSIPVLLVGVALTVHKVNRHRLRAMYVDMAEQSQAREYCRAPDPPGWTLQPGSAAELYQEAAELCDPGALNGDDRMSLIAAQRLGLGLPPGYEEWPPLSDVDAKVLDEACSTLGVSTDDPMMQYLLPSTCDWLASCLRGSRPMRAGSRRVDTVSPLSIWSPWTLAEDGIASRRQTRFMKLAAAMIIEGQIAATNGDRGRRLENALALMRAGQDMSRGGGIQGISACFFLQGDGQRVLAALLRQGDVPPQEADRLYQELAYINAQPPSFAEAHQDTFVEVMSRVFDGAGLPGPQTARQWQAWPMTREDRVAVALLTGRLLRDWPAVWAAAETPYPRRIQAFHEIDVGWPHPSFTDTRWLAPADYSVFAFDRRLAFRQSSLHLLQLAMAFVAHSADIGAPPRSLEELRAFDLDVPLIDPLSDEPYEMVHEDGAHVLRSPALDPTRHADFALDTFHNITFEDHLSLTLPAVGSRQEGP